MQLTDDWLLVKVALLLIGLTKNSWTKYCFNHRVPKVAPAAFWRTFSHEGRISPGW